MKEITIEDVLNDDVREQWLLGQVQSLRHSGFSETKASQIAVEQWEELKVKLTASLNRQGCRWVVSNERRPTKEKFYYAEDSVGNRTMIHFWKDHWHSLTGHPVAKWYDDESIEPCATSSEIYWKQRCEAAEILVNSMSKYFENDKYSYKYYNDWKKLKSQTPSPTGDRNCEELKERIEQFKEWVHLELKLQGYEHEQILNKLKQLLNL